MRFMKRTLNTKGFGKKEVIVGFLVILGVMAVYFTVLKDKIGPGSGASVRNVAEQFYSTVLIFKDKHPTDDDMYYVYDLFNSEEKHQFMDPNNKEQSCDYFESYVKIGSPNEMHFKCGKYLVEWNKKENKYHVYEVGEWQTEEVYNDTEELYNYKKDGKLVLEKSVSLKEFLIAFQSREMYEVLELDDVKSYIDSHKDKNIELVQETGYRTKKQIAEY